MKSGLYPLPPQVPEKKPAIQSKGLWGSLLGTLPLIYVLEKVLDLPPGMLDETYVAVVGAVGLALQVWGRLKGHSAISGLFRVK